MKKIALAVVAVVALLLVPVSADGAPSHHGKPVVSRVIDWD